MTVLAQIAGPGANSTPIPSLPRPPLLAHYLLENPWPAVIALVIAGFVALAWLNAQGKLATGVRAAGAAVLLALAVFACASLVTTDREVLQGRTKELVDGTATAKTSALREMLTENARVFAFGPIPEPQGRAAILEIVERSLGAEHPVQEHTVGAVQAVVDGPNVARTQVRVWLKFNENVYNAPVGVTCRIDWTREAQAGGAYAPWRVRGITVLQADPFGVNPNVGRE